LITGKCRDIGGFVVPSLRGLAAREPYFHNGTAKSIRAVVDFYSARFRYLDPADQSKELPLSEQEKVDLTNFLAAL
jgi:cytochrome c peroxidase